MTGGMADATDLAPTRLDLHLVQHGLFETRAQAQAAIRAGAVTVDGRVASKPSSTVPAGAAISATPAHPWVSRGGVKLAAALDRFGIDPVGRHCLDIGASTGGFTHVLLARGAASVTAVDVGRGQFHARLAGDPRVRLHEGLDARALTAVHLLAPPSLIVADVSFISLDKALTNALALAAPRAVLAVLVKPQFEVGRARIGRGGIVRDEAARADAIAGVAGWLDAEGWAVRGHVPSPITGGDGNQETLLAADRR